MRFSEINDLKDFCIDVMNKRKGGNVEIAVRLENVK